MLVLRCRKPRSVALWNGQAAQVTIGTARRTHSACHPGNRHAGTRARMIVMSHSGIVKSAAMASRRRRVVVRVSAARADQASSPGVWTAAV